MSTFEGPLTEIDGVSVDRFNHKNELSRAYFLSHCHSDHMIGLTDNYFTRGPERKDVYLYASELSSVILKNRFPRLSQYVKVLNFNKTNNIIVPGTLESEDKFIGVKIIPAGHCPGSVMFLFTTIENKNILYTGDFRISKEDLPKLKQLNDEAGAPIQIDKMYFDSTFWSDKFPHFPSRDLSCEVICDIIAEWISKGKNYLVSLNLSAYYGSEALYIALSKKLKLKIHVRDLEFKTYRHLVDLDDVFTLNSEETQIHSCSGIKKSRTGSIDCRQNADKLQIRCLKPSALRWMNINQKSNIFKETSGSFYVCYSSHGSLNELKGFINYFKPKAIEPCVVPADYMDFYKSINNFCKDFLEVPCKHPFVKKPKFHNSNELLEITNSDEQNTSTVFEYSDDSEDNAGICNRKVNSVHSEMELTRNQNVVIMKKKLLF